MEGHAELCRSTNDGGIATAEEEVEEGGTETRPIPKKFSLSKSNMPQQQLQPKPQNINHLQRSMSSSNS
jgi:hypothetical protein